jgi:hypothetical protein
MDFWRGTGLPIGIHDILPGSEGNALPDVFSLGGPQLVSVMPKVVNRIAEEVLQVHGRLKERVPTDRVVHSQRPVARAHALEPFENGPMHLVELADEARPAKQTGSGARAHPR